MTQSITPQQRAETCARLMMEKDTATTALGMALDHIEPGAATLSMPVTSQMLNGHGTCHGGYIFTLADSAFAFACNSYNQNVVAQQNQITYLAPAMLNDLLTATARDVSRQGRTGICDVAVHNQKGQVIALFRGLSRTIKGQHFDEAEEHS